MWIMAVKKHRIVDFYLRIWVSELRLNSYSFYVNDLKDGDELKCVIVINIYFLCKAYRIITLMTEIICRGTHLHLNFLIMI